MNYKKRVVLFLLLLINAGLIWGSNATGNGGISVRGAGTSILTGGGPGTTPIPIITKLALKRK